MLRDLESNHASAIDLKSTKYSIGCSVIVAILAAIYASSRIGLPDLHLRDLTVFSGLAFFLLNAPSTLLRIRRLGMSGNLWLNESLLTWYLLLLLVLFSYFSNPFISYLLGAAGVFCLGQNIRALRPIGLERADLVNLAILLVLSIWIASVCWRGDVLSPLFVESLQIAELNGSSLDPLFHIAIAQIVKHYDTISNGLHGLGYVKYHFFSHVVLARLSALTDTHMIYTYNIGYVLIFPALLLKSFLVVIDVFKGLFKASDKYKNLTLIILALGLSSYIPLYAFNDISTRAFIATNSLFVSESYLFSVLLFLAVTHTLLLSRRESSEFKYVMLVFLPLSLAFITLSKVSAGYLFVMVAGYFFLRIGLYRSLTAWIAMIIMVSISAGIAYLTIDPGATKSGIEWMSFFTVEAKTRVRYFVFLFYFWLHCAVLAWFVLLRRQKESGHTRVSKIQLALEATILMAITGFIPPILMRILGGSGLYFLEPHRWLALMVFIAIAPSAIKALKVKFNIIRILKVAGVLVLCFNTSVNAAKAVKHNLLCRTFYVRPAFAENLASINSKNLLTAHEIREKVLTPALIDSFGYYVVRNPVNIAFDHLKKMDEKQHTGKMIYIQDYTLLHERIVCYHYFYMIPALTGFAAFQGIDYWCVGEGYFVDKGEVRRTNYDNYSFCKEMASWDINGFYSYDLSTGAYELVNCQDSISTLRQDE